MVEIPQPVAADARFFNREQSWLQFNLRVLEEALDPALPLVERARFLAIVSSNLDEFVMVRLAELHRSRTGHERDDAGLPPAQRLDLARERIADLVGRQYACWSEDVEPALAAEGFTIRSPEAWSDENREGLRSLFASSIEPGLTPLAVDPTRPFPMVANLGLVVAVALRGELDEADAPLRRALVAVPKGRRLLPLPSTIGGHALLEDVILTFAGRLFPGHRVAAAGVFRVSRDASLELDEDPTQDLLSELEEELHNRGRGQPVRLEVRQGFDDDLRAWLEERLGLEPADVFRVDGPLDLTCLFAVDGLLGRDDLCYPSFAPQRFPELEEDPFTAIRSQEWLLHHPFDDFAPVVRLVQQAAADSRVLAIKQTLYRVSGDSPIVKALASAARSGIQVTVLVELKARFDEEANIRWAKTLEEAGAHVVYGLKGLKVHAKLLLVVRRDEDGVRRYCHLGTGNYNDKTARIYTDISYLTCNEAVGRDVAKLFNVITGWAHPPEYERLAASPMTMRTSFVRWIRHEADHARAGRGGRIIAKFNSMVDVGLAEELYRASQAGVEIDLIVRGMCILRPGLPGLSEHLRVTSIVGRFLEHSRIFFFAGGGRPVLAIASADWMSRNLDRRVEHLVQIVDEPLHGRLYALLEAYLHDRRKSRRLQPDGSHRRLAPEAGQEPRDIQDELTRPATAGEPDHSVPLVPVFQPMTRGDRG